MTTSEPNALAAEPVRRPFFRLLTFITGGVAAAVAGFPILQYFFSEKRKKAIWVPLGLASEFPDGSIERVAEPVHRETDDAETSQRRS